MCRFLIRKVLTGTKFDLLAANGEAVAASQVYSARPACLRGVESVRRCALLGRVADLTEAGAPVPANPRFELYLDRRGEYRFRLKAANGLVIAASEGYRTKSACLNGIDSVIKNAPTAQVDEE